MQKGDSGSVVIDAATNAIYGHVVGVNPIGEVYVSPYAAIIEQIRNMLHSNKVEIPEPLRTLECLISKYTKLAKENAPRNTYEQTITELNQVKEVAVRSQQLHPSDNNVVLGGQKPRSTLHSTSSAQSMDTVKSPKHGPKPDAAQDGTSTVFCLRSDLFGTVSNFEHCKGQAISASSFPSQLQPVTQRESFVQSSNPNVHITDLAEMSPPPGLPGSLTIQPHTTKTLQFDEREVPEINLPCNILLVGNLPTDTSEEDLKALFSQQLGYKRLCSRLKQEGTMCFVEFKDVLLATEALNKLNGYVFRNSTEGGIRLSYLNKSTVTRSNPQPVAVKVKSSSVLNQAGYMKSDGFNTARVPILLRSPICQPSENNE